MEIPTYIPTGVEVDYCEVLHGGLFRATTVGTGGGCEALEVRPTPSLLNARPDLSDLRVLITDWRTLAPSRDDDDVCVGVYRWSDEDPGWHEPLVTFFDLSPAPEQAAAQVLAALEQAAAA